MLIKGNIFVVCGPSGSGKTTLAKSLLKSAISKMRLMRSVSLTTRPKRSTEADKKDYFFVSKKEFQRLKRAKKILEWTRYLGYDYGTPKDFIDQNLSKDKQIIMCLDLKGARRIKRSYPSCATAIFIMPPSLSELEKRIRNRCGATSEKEIKRRIFLAKKEIKSAQGFDYCIVNDNLKTAQQKLRGIIESKIKGR
ncbi:MAG: guanylate kinase [Candidatus Omnitrophica bacterium]|jgi:guanylate kinase|nr:guanylate kinase [Candidatus Omnitrophota bacterium]